MPISGLPLKTAYFTLGILSALPALAEEGGRSGKVSFYFAAHEDDWQLFMNPSAFDDVVNHSAKTVFVHVTAGDAGLGIGDVGRKHPLYLARENGAVRAIQFMADADDAPVAGVTAHISLNEHSIYRKGYRNTVSYFLRVPDGNGAGTGYEHTSFQSLRRLADGENNTLSAIDGSTTYHGWNDLVLTLRKIVDFERGNATIVQLNVAELDLGINPHDHYDHLMTAKAALDAVADLDCVRRIFFVDYAKSRLPENLNGQQRDMQSAVFAITLAGILEFDHRSAWHRYEQSFIGRNYFRVEEGKGPCNVDGTEVPATKR